MPFEEECAGAQREKEIVYHLIQAYLFITSAASVYLVSRTDKWHKWGFVAGLLSEPGWLYMAYTTNQWAVLLLTLWWTYYWGAGAYRRFFKENV